MNSKQYKHSEVTQIIIGAFYQVYNTLGYGFLEKVYENALTVALQKQHLSVKQQYPISVYFDNVEVGHYLADMVVEDVILLELKATRTLLPEHEAQLLNYLKATPIEVGLLLNFGIRPKVVRKAYANERKQITWVKSHK